MNNSKSVVLRKFNPNKGITLKNSVPRGTVRSGVHNRINPINFEEIDEI